MNYSFIELLIHSKRKSHLLLSYNKNAFWEVAMLTVTDKKNFQSANFLLHVQILSLETNTIPCFSWNDRLNSLILLNFKKLFILSFYFEIIVAPQEVTKMVQERSCVSFTQFLPMASPYISTISKQGNRQWYKVCIVLCHFITHVSLGNHDHNLDSEPFHHAKYLHCLSLCSYTHPSPFTS